MKSISPFEYNYIVSGDQFIGREKEVAKLISLIKNKQNAFIYGPPKIGKSSIVYNSLYQLRDEGYKFKVCIVNLFNIRFVEDLICLIVKNILKLYDKKTQIDIKKTLLKNIDIESINSNHLSDKELKSLILFPDNCAKHTSTHIIVYFKQFQNILLFDKSLKALSLIEESVSISSHCSYIIVGDKRNAMEYIFNEKNYFRNIVFNIKIAPIEKKRFIKYVCDKFYANGKIAQEEESGYIYDLMEGDPWYIQHLAEICFAHTDKELTKQIVDESIERLFTLHDYELNNTVYNLSTHQLLFIKAILDGERHFSKMEIMKKYHLNSSANVNRLREALTKKEIVTFINKNKIEFNDALLKLWLGKHFFSI